MGVAIKEIVKQKEKSEKICELTEDPESFYKEIRSQGVKEMTLRFVIRELFRKKEIDSLSGDKLYQLYEVYINDYKQFNDKLYEIRKGDLEKLCMDLRTCRDKK